MNWRGPLQIIHDDDDDDDEKLNVHLYTEQISTNLSSVKRFRRSIEADNFSDFIHTSLLNRFAFLYFYIVCFAAVL